MTVWLLLIYIVGAAATYDAARRNHKMESDTSAVLAVCWPLALLAIFVFALYVFYADVE